MKIKEGGKSIGTMTGKEVFPKRLRELINTTDLTIEQFASILGRKTKKCCLDNIIFRQVSLN